MKCVEVGGFLAQKGDDEGGNGLVIALGGRVPRLEQLLVIRHQTLNLNRVSVVNTPKPFLCGKRKEERGGGSSSSSRSSSSSSSRRRRRRRRRRKE